MEIEGIDLTAEFKDNNIDAKLDRIADSLSEISSVLQHIKSPLTNFTTQFKTMGTEVDRTSKRLKSTLTVISSLQRQINQSVGINLDTKSAKESAKVFEKAYSDIEKARAKASKSFSPVYFTQMATLDAVPAVKSNFNMKSAEESAKVFEKAFGKKGVDYGFINSVKQLDGSLKGVTKSAKESYEVFQQYGKIPNKINPITSTLDKLKTKLNGLAGIIGKLFIGRQILGFISDSLKESIAYTEDMNLFGVALGNNAEKALEFSDAMDKAFHFDTGEFNKNVGLFYQISSSLGLASDKAYTLSQNFSKLALDLSSFYNISTDEAVTKLQAGLVGETEPLRRLGIVITENNLAETARNLGITKSIRNMTEAEKIQLRYITALNQTKNAQGDLARTINQPANQLKMLTQQFTVLKRNVGNLFVGIVAKIAPVLNGIIIALNTIISRLASLLGLSAKFTPSGNTGLGGVKDGLDAVTDSAGKTAKAIKDATLGIDELNIISADTGNGGVGGDTGTYDTLDLDLSGYDNLMDSISNKAQEIADKILLWAENAGKFIDFMGNGDGKVTLQDILDTVLKIGGAILGWKIGSALSMFIPNFDDMSLKDQVLNKLQLALSGLVVGLSVTWFISEFIENMREGVDPESIGQMVVASIVAGLGTAWGAKVLGATGALALEIGLVATIVLLSITLGQALGDKIAKKITDRNDKESLVGKLYDKLNQDGFMENGNIVLRFLASIVIVVTGIVEEVANVYKKIEEALGKEKTLDVAFEVTTATASPGTKIYAWLTKEMLKIDWVKLGEDVEKGWNTVVEKTSTFSENASKNIKTFVENASTEFNTFKENASKNINTFKENASTSFNTFSENASEKLKDIKDKADEKLGELKDNAIENLTSLKDKADEKLGELKDNATENFATVKKNILEKTKEIGEKLEEDLGDWKDNVSTKMGEISDKFDTKWGDIKKVFKNKWNDIVDWWKKSAIGKWWDEHVAPWFTKEKWVDVMKGVKDGFTTTFKNAVNSAIELFNKFINWVNKMLKFEWDAVVVAGQEIVPAGSVQLFTIPNIPKLARGGMLNRGSIFEMGENNKAEMLASYNNRQTVIPLENTSFISALKQAVYEGSLNAQPVGAGGYGDITVPVYIGGKQVSKEVYKMSEEGKKMIGNVIGKGGNFR